MNEMFNFIVLALSTFALSTLLTYYNGPGDILLRLRTRFKKSPLECAVCTSVWVAVLLFIATLLGAGHLLIPFAVVGVVILLERV